MKIAQNIAVTALFGPSRLVSATAYYNGQSITTGSDVMLDVKDYGSAAFVVKIGEKVGPVATLFNSIYQSQTNDPTTATLLAGASFTTLGTSNAGQDLLVGAVDCGASNRYLCLKTEVQSSMSATIDMSAIAVLGNAQTLPATLQTLEFDV